MFWTQQPFRDDTSSTRPRGQLNPYILGGLPETDLPGSVREQTKFLNQNAIY
jgi:hypothetical protein